MYSSVLSHFPTNGIPCSSFMLFIANGKSFCASVHFAASN